MHNAVDTLPKHKHDFARVYDLDDPSPYFTALRPADYRMPQVLAGALRSIHHSVARAKGVDSSLRILDFACGYGVIGALLRHKTSMHDIFEHYGQRHWHPDDKRTYWKSDIEFFQTQRDESSQYQIGGADIAGVALEYARTLGFLDEVFNENLIEVAPSDRLRGFIGGTHLVVESGSLGDMLPLVFERILDVFGTTPRPWFIYCPRPDIAWEVMDSFWQTRDYQVQSLSTGPVRYRKALSESERADMMRITRSMGKADETVMRDEYLLVDMKLVRPTLDAHKWPIGQFQENYD